MDIHVYIHVRQESARTVTSAIISVIFNSLPYSLETPSFIEFIFLLLSWPVNPIPNRALGSNVHAPMPDAFT